MEKCLLYAFLKWFGTPFSLIIEEEYVFVNVELGKHLRKSARLRELIHRTKSGLKRLGLESGYTF